jgi:hypothetical protein
MGSNKRWRRSRGAKQRAPHLPRYIIEHLGQILRNRSREDLRIPLPSEMLTMLEEAGRGSAVGSGLDPVDGEDQSIC